MRVALASTWHPRGELFRLRQIHSQLERAYARIVIVVPPDADPDEVLPMQQQPGCTIVSSPRPEWARYVAIEHALATDVSHLHYADMDRLLHWVEIQPTEWREATAAIQQTDCLILGRTERAFATHPQALQQTERIINGVGSYLLGQAVDFGGGSRGFSRAAAQAVVDGSAPGRWGDIEWPLLVQQAGLKVAYLALDGLEWESADRYRRRVADPASQRAAAERYDQQPSSWARRVEMAREIVHEGLAVVHP